METASWSIVRSLAATLTEYARELLQLDRRTEALKAVEEALQLAESASRHDPASARASAEYREARTVVTQIESRIIP